MEVSAKTKKFPTPIKVNYKLLDAKTTAELSKNFGDEVVFNAAKSAIVISLQAGMRRHIEKGEGKVNGHELQKWAEAWKPDVRSMVKLSALEKASAVIPKLSPEERAKLIKELQAMK